MKPVVTNIPIGSDRSPHGATAGLPPAALDACAARLRQAGLFLALLNADGSVAYHDAEASPFFRLYVLPILATPGMAARAADRPAAPIELPGALAASWPHVERKQVRGVFVIAARAESFSLDEDVLRACGATELDGPWLRSQAERLPGYNSDAVVSQARLLPMTVQDQVRLAGMQGELDSLSGQLAGTYEELSLVYQVSGGMRVNRRAPDFFRGACMDVMGVMQVRAMGFALSPHLLQGGGAPELCGEINLPAEHVRRLADGLMADLVQRKSPLLIHDLATDRTFGWLAADARQLLAVPLQRGEQVLGCLFALDKEDAEFDSSDSKLLNSIANESAIYLENAMLFEDVHGLMMGLLHSLTSAVDAKDTYTCGHSERVALVCRHMAQQMGLGDREVEQVYMAGLLHDVGKIGVPEVVLHKAGRLTAEEFEQIKRHPEMGAKILADVKQLREIVPGVLHHHERYDGKGYPAGLSGENIPLLGRVICLADCFDAMTSSRTYRKALPLEVALTEIRRCAGTQFDPRLAEHFLRTGPDGFRELLRDHQRKARQLRELQESARGK